MNSQDLQLPHNYQVVIDRFVAACEADERVVAAFLGGSYARDEADEHSDLDLGVITTDEAYREFVAGLDSFLRDLGEPIFLETFGSSDVVFFIFAEGTECELAHGSESDFEHIHTGPYKVLLDKKGILEGANFTGYRPTQEEQAEALRRLVFWFWHDLSHFTTAMARGELWWAYGQIEQLRKYCLNLARLKRSFTAETSDYEKVEKVIPPDELSPLAPTFCPMEYNAMLRSAQVIIQYYQELAPSLAQEHGVTYPERLSQVMLERLDELGKSQAS